MITSTLWKASVRSGLRAVRRVGTTLLALLVIAEIVGLAAYAAELVRRSNRRLSSGPAPAGRPG